MQSMKLPGKVLTFNVTVFFWFELNTDLLKCHLWISKIQVIHTVFKCQTATHVC